MASSKIVDIDRLLRCIVASRKRLASRDSHWDFLLPKEADKLCGSMKRKPPIPHKLTLMTEPTENEIPDTGPKKRRAIFPWIVLGMVAAVIIGLYAFDGALAEAFNMDPAIKHLAAFILILLAINLIGLWYLIRHGRSSKLGTIVAILAVLSPIGFLVLYQPVFGGNANVLKFEPRLWNARTAGYGQAASVTTSQLTPTEFDFPQFLGPDRDGIVRNVELASWKDTQPELLWRQRVGEAWSAFAVVNGFAITQEQREDLECVVCYEIESGDTVWVHSVKRRHEDYVGFGRVGPRATPTIEDGNVYAVGGTGVLDCLNGEDGSPKWSYDIAAACGIEHVIQTNSRGLEFTQENSSLSWGRSQSPLVVDDLLIVAGGGVAKTGQDTDPTDRRVETPGATLIALNKNSGEEVWRGGDRPIAYGSPTVATVAGVRQILLMAEDHCVGHDVETGEELWAFKWEGSSDGAASCSQVTVIDDTHLLISKGYSTGAQIIELQTKEDGSIEVIAEKRDPRLLKTKFSNPVIRDGFAYAISARFLECDEVMTLKKKWRRRGFGTGQLLLVGDKLLVHSEDGKLFLVEAVPDEYRELGSIKTVSGTCWNTLALFNDLVLVRSEEEAACFRLPLE